MDERAFVKAAKALSDPTRHRMLRAVSSAGEMTCSQVCKKFALSQPTISHHLKTLASAGLLDVRKDGAFHVVSVNKATLRAFAKAVTGK